MIIYLLIGTIVALIGRIVDRNWKTRHSAFIISLWPVFVVWAIYEIVKPDPNDPA